MCCERACSRRHREHIPSSSEVVHAQERAVATARSVWGVAIVSAPRRVHDRSGVGSGESRNEKINECLGRHVESLRVKGQNGEMMRK
jgi:hypothetical protein